MEERPNTTQEQFYQEVELMEPNLSTRYIDPKTDFGFKHFFGKEVHKDLLIKFLNSLFNGRKVIVDLQYNNPEHSGLTKKHRKTTFDLFCTGNKGEKFIIEMQKVSQKYFKDRMIYCTSSLIQEQARGKRKWNFKLPVVYFVGLLNFSLKDSDPDSYIHGVHLADESRNQLFYSKLRYLFVEIPKFNKAEHELQTDQDRWLYMLKNLENLDNIPQAWSEKPEFVKLLLVIRIIFIYKTIQIKWFGTHSEYNKVDVTTIKFKI